MPRPQKIYYADGPDGPATVKVTPIHNLIITVNGEQKIFYCNSNGYFTLRDPPQWVVRKRPQQLLEKTDQDEEQQKNILMRKIMTKLVVLIDTPDTDIEIFKDILQLL